MPRRCRQVRGFLIAVGMLMACGGTVEAQPQTSPRCFLLRVNPGGILQQCDNRLRSLAIDLTDLRRQAVLDPTGAFRFVCPVEVLCPDAPSIAGWLIDPRRWTRSNRDEQTIFQIFQQPPRGGFVAGGWLTPAQPNPVCDMFDIEIAGLSGRAVCYESDDPKTTAVVAAVANEEVGYLLAFYQQDVDWQTLRDRMLGIVPRFRIVVDTGDIGLLRWMP